MVKSRFPPTSKINVTNLTFVINFVKRFLFNILQTLNYKAIITKKKIVFDGLEKNIDFGSVCNIIIIPGFQCTFPQNYKLRPMRSIFFDLVKAWVGVFLLCFLGQIVT